MSSIGTHGGNGTSEDGEELFVELAPDAKFYHDGVGANCKRPHKKGSLVPLAERPFVAWDGESGSGHNMVQDYHLFVAVTPDGPLSIRSRNGLRTMEMLRFIVDVEERYPDAIHVGFGFGYDINQILGTLNRYQLETIHKTGVLYLDCRRWRLEWRKGKTLTITRDYGQGHKTSVVIFDVFHFFMSSFVGALAKFGTAAAETLATIDAGKKRRGTFTYDEIDDYVLPYCVAECEELVRLMEHFRTLLYGVGFTIKHWHGPGAIASFLMRHYGIKHAMAEPPEPVKLASQYAYAAGRFELMKVGHAGPVWSVDINSAYPDAIRQLPNLAEGEWVHVTEPKRIERFGVYRVTGGPGYRAMFTSKPAPLWHRDHQGRISFPWQIDGWYWSPEAALVIASPHYTVSEGWVFRPKRNIAPPFAFVERMYNQRQEWKAAGNPAEYALKLGMNSLYGKMAQRVGWDQKKMRPPPWHQLEWAGWVTAYCRAKMYRAAAKLGWDTIVAIETDGLYTTRNPSEAGFKASKALGEYSVDYYNDCVYVQSGLAWLKSGDEWTQKYRGLDPESLPLSKMVEHLSHIDWDQKVEATTTRFVGIGAALMSRDYAKRWRVWETVPRLLAVGGDGKRVHIRQICQACRNDMTPMQTPHELVITIPKPGMSQPHFLPWRPEIGKDPPWRKGEAVLKELIREV